MYKIFLRHLFIAFGLFASIAAYSQVPFSQIDENGTISRRSSSDSLSTHKEIPIGIRVWTVDKKFGDRTAAIPDTLQHMFMNTIFTSGMRGEYNTLGNLGAPRIHRIFIDRSTEHGDFIFTQPYDYFITPTQDFPFTNTLSPITNLTYNTAGDRVNGEDHFTATFGINAGKKLGLGFKFNYLYGRGFYSNQSTAHFNYTMYGSYLGDRYQAHLLLSTNHQKTTENGGIADDNYITHPESYTESFQANEIPTVLEQNWNRNDNQHLFFTHRYSLGFNKKVKMTDQEIRAIKFALESKKQQNTQNQNKFGRNTNEVIPTGRPADAQIAGNEPQTGKTDSIQRTIVTAATADSILKAQKDEEKKWYKTEYVPVTSFIHTLQLDNYRRIYQAYQSPQNFYAHTYPNVGKLPGDSIFDKTNHYRIKNTFALSLLEGFHRWAKIGLKAFITSDLAHYTLPDTMHQYQSFTEHNLSVGGQIAHTAGKYIQFSTTAETWLLGENIGQFRIDGTATLRVPFLQDTLSIAALAFLHHDHPDFYYRHYHSKHFWWDNTNLSKIIHSRIQATLSYPRTHTTIRVAADQLQNHTFLVQNYTAGTSGNTYTANSIDVRQGGSTSLFTLEVSQDFKFGPLLWENVLTYQKSSRPSVLPVPDLNLYSNLYLKFKIAKVLNCHLGADVRYFTAYQAPLYSPALGQFTVQESNPIKIGNYPIVNVYANFLLKNTRFFVLMEHLNSGMGKKEYFLTPHYPTNERILRFGLSWNFFN